jgi:hypothetical protein
VLTTNWAANVSRIPQTALPCGIGPETEKTSRKMENEKISKKTGAKLNKNPKQSMHSYRTSLPIICIDVKKSFIRRSLIWEVTCRFFR